MGIWERVETQIETLEEARMRLSFSDESLKKEEFEVTGKWFPKSREEAPGKDLYWLMTSIQIVLIIYVLFFFENMLGYDHY